MMRADDGCTDHLQSRVTHSASSECLQDHIPQAAVGPPTELTKDRIPVAKFLRQIAPGRAGSHQPKHRVEHAAMIARWSATTPYQERLDIRPLIVGHQSANHGRSPQRAALNQFAIPASIDLSTRPNRGIQRDWAGYEGQLQITLPLRTRGHWYSTQRRYFGTGLKW